VEERKIGARQAWLPPADPLDQQQETSESGRGIDESTTSSQIRKSSEELAKVKSELFLLISSVKNGTCDLQLQDVRNQVRSLRERISMLEKVDLTTTAV